MNFENLVIKITPKLKQLSIKYNGHRSFFDEDDLLSEMILHLWKKWRNKKFTNKTESYIIQSCYFYLRNFLRIVQNKQRFISIDEPINEAGVTLKELIPDRTFDVSEFVEEKMFIKKVMNNGLSKIEKDIFQLLYKEFTIREIGKKLNISHTMVLKHKKKILGKVSKKDVFLLV